MDDKLFFDQRYKMAKDVINYVERFFNTLDQAILNIDREQRAEFKEFRHMWE